jgi:hypothetical protein
MASPEQWGLHCSAAVLVVLAEMTMNGFILRYVMSCSQSKNKRRFGGTSPHI